MDKKTIEIIVIVVGLLVLGVVLFGGNLKPSRSMRSGVGTSSVTDVLSEFDTNVKMLANKEINDSLEELVDSHESGSEKRNPFLVKVRTTYEVIEEEVIPEPEFTVSGIVRGDTSEESAVIIEGDFYYITDVIDGWKIERIETDRVFFKNKDVEYIYNLYTPEDSF